MTDFARLRTAVLQDAELQRRVFAEFEEHALIELLAATARERGLAVGQDELRAELQQARRSWFERHVP